MKIFIRWLHNSLSSLVYGKLYTSRSWWYHLIMKMGHLNLWCNPTLSVNYVSNLYPTIICQPVLSIWYLRVTMLGFLNATYQFIFKTPWVGLIRFPQFTNKEGGDRQGLLTAPHLGWAPQRRLSSAHDPIFWFTLLKGSFTLTVHKYKLSLYGSTWKDMALMSVT